jgi:hypothetical protein
MRTRGHREKLDPTYAGPSNRASYMTLLCLPAHKSIPSSPCYSQDQEFVCVEEVRVGSTSTSLSPPPLPSFRARREVGGVS